MIGNKPNKGDSETRNPRARLQNPGLVAVALALVLVAVSIYLFSQQQMEMERVRLASEATYEAMRLDTAATRAAEDEQRRARTATLEAAARLGMRSGGVRVRRER